MREEKQWIKLVFHKMRRKSWSSFRYAACWRTHWACRRPEFGCRQKTGRKDCGFGQILIDTKVSISQQPETGCYGGFLGGCSCGDIGNWQTPRQQTVKIRSRKKVVVLTLAANGRNWGCRRPHAEEKLVLGFWLWQLLHNGFLDVVVTWWQQWLCFHSWLGLGPI